MRFWTVLPLLALANCAGVVEGYSQKITVVTTPPGATCRLDRAGTQLGTIDTTPGSVVVSPKTAENIEVTCEKPGFSRAAATNKSDTSAAVFGNILLGGVIGAIADRQTGAAYKYDSVVNVTLSPAAVPVSGPPQS